VQLHLKSLVSIALALLLSASPAFADNRTQLKPGSNHFTPQQDIELGRKAALEYEKKLPMCNAPKVDAYLTKLGNKLVDQLTTAGVDYPWEFHCVNDKDINAFALPGGFVFINRGAIEAANNEAQLAGVMAHEISHVALRHGTNQLSKAQNATLLTGVLAAAGSIFGEAAAAAAAGVGQLATGSVLLKYSRGAETQADIMGTQILYDAGYDPRALEAFFENLNSSTAKGKAPPQFFSDHPNPDNRAQRIQLEISKLGGVPDDARSDSAEFEATKRLVIALPVVAKPKPAPITKPALPAPGTVKVAAPSETLIPLQTGKFSLNYPDNWKTYGKDENVTLAPDGGLVDSGNGQAAIAYGMIISVAAAQSPSAQRNSAPPSADDALKVATQELIDSLQHENAAMQITRAPKPITLNNQPALSTYFSNDSPGAGQETDWLITVQRPEGLLSFICVAPQPDFSTFTPAFTNILNSVRFSNEPPVGAP
jgi:beta-barrel assembly-enhancing protease